MHTVDNTGGGGLLLKFFPKSLLFVQNCQGVSSILRFIVFLNKFLKIRWGGGGGSDIVPPVHIYGRTKAVQTG
jgi:hypothetical protein